MISSSPSFPRERTLATLLQEICKPSQKNSYRQRTKRVDLVVFSSDRFPVSFYDCGKSATAIEIAGSTSPIPIHWRYRIPVGIPVNFLAIGMKIRSSLGTRRNMNTRGITGTEGPGTWNPIEELCWIVNVRSSAKQVFMNTVLRISAAFEPG